MLELFFAIMLGILLGIITGLLPGLHVNSVAAIMFSILPLLSDFFSLFAVAVIVVAMTITHVFFDFMPSIFLGAPEDSTIMSVLPGHALLLEGKGLFAFRLAVLGAILGLVAIVALAPLLVKVVPFIFNTVQPFIGFFLIFVSVFVILREETVWKKILACCIFFISGILGIMVFDLGIREPLLPLLAGLFGVSTLLKSLFDNAVIPPQNDSEDIPLEVRPSINSFFAGLFSGGLLCIFPAVGPAQSAILARAAFRKLTSESYLIMLGCIASVSAVFALITLFSISKARNGSIVIVSQFINVDNPVFYALLFVMLISGGFAAILALNLARYFSVLIRKLNYHLLSICTIIFMVFLVFLFSGWLGLVVLVTSTGVGLLALSLATGRHNAMGCLMIPVILHYIL